MKSIAFGAIAAVMLATGLMVVSSKNLVRAALWLGAMLLGTAVLYAIMDASFLASVQVLLYVGGVITLMIFGVMITRKHEGLEVPAETMRPSRAMAVSALLFLALAAAVDKTEGLEQELLPAPPTTADLGRAFLVEHVLAFEVLSVLLLGTIVGAIVLARRRDLGAAVGLFPATPPMPTGSVAPTDEEPGSKVAA